MNPYEDLPQSAFWKTAVANRSMFDVDEIWNPKFRIQKKHKILTYGSCFAQHIGRALDARGFNWLRPEQAPRGMSAANATRFNYGIFSTRTANIYTTSLLRQWTEWALAGVEAPGEVWTHGDRYLDPFRPRIEPDGFETPEELYQSRSQTIRSFAEGIKEADFFVFTLGLTESWINKDLSYEYPMCPGTVGGVFDESQHIFQNQQFQKVLNNLIRAIDLIRGANQKIKFILTVSPVPLAATMTDRHVAVATMASKSVLRAVADQVSANRPNVDYFPSYEIISSPIFKGAFFEPNQRQVNPVGVNFVMDNFFRCQEDKFGPLSPSAEKKAPDGDNLEIVCEEEILGAFQNA
ncbi:GSCFA domain-containing protein [Pseudophaeobacter leonis]|uniref:GSCFA domain-containing protein n=1 Tax=Pseudophaeobacter leonis TaxID=1144477 RepID=UPI0009F370FB|nr:GSCFA domain-containing protein [Pseudophaeobacter leonis]